MPITVKDLRYTYNPGMPGETVALSDVSFDVADGTVLGIIGHTGSGKSTLLQTLNGLIKPTSGEIYIDGECITDGKAKMTEIRRKVGLVFQYPEYQLFEETVRKDVAFGPKNLGLDEEEQEARVKKAIGLVGLDYEEIRKKALEVKPKMIIAGFSAYSGIVDWARMRAIADEVGAYLLVDMAHVAGLIAAGVYPSPVDHAHVVTSTTHKSLGGPRSGFILSNCHDEGIYKKLNSAIFPGTQGGPLEHIIAAKAIVFKEAMEPWYVEYQKQIVKNASLLAEEVKKRGYKVVSGGTHNHLFLMDFIGLEMTGKDAEAALGKAYITVNKNTVPGEPRSPFVTSGIRVGTPACTRRGFKENEIKELAAIMCDVLDNYQNDEVILKCRERVKALCKRFPVYKD